MKQTPQTDMLLTVIDLAELLSVTTRTVRRLCAADLLPRPVRITMRTVRWRASEIQHYLDGLADRRTTSAN